MESTDVNAMYPTVSEQVNAAIELSKKDQEIEKLKKEFENNNRLIKDLHKELCSVEICIVSDTDSGQEKRHLKICNKKKKEIEKWKQYYSMEMLKRDVKIAEL
jgi:predicted RNase H-like nuclease (RuvC/YqgF family)